MTPEEINKILKELANYCPKSLNATYLPPLFSEKGAIYFDGDDPFTYATKAKRFAKMFRLVDDYADSFAIFLLLDTLTLEGWYIDLYSEDDGEFKCRLWHPTLVSDYVATGKSRGEAVARVCLELWKNPDKVNLKKETA